jgi:preprotein translocase subunit SecG
MPQGLPGIRTPAGRAAVVTALCAAAAVGLQARGALSSTADAWAPRVGMEAFYDAAGIVMGVAVVEAAVVLTLLTRGRAGKPGEHVASPLALPWWGRMLARLFALVLIGVPVALVVLGHRGGGAGLLSPQHSGLSPGIFGHARGQAASVNASALAGLVLTVAALAVAAVLTRRGRPRSTGLPGTAADAENENQLRAAVSAGAGALHDAASPRAAIIACYAAMEASLTRAGAAPADADTPDEVLARAAAGGLIRSGAAAELTGLFRRARYGGREMTEADRAAAIGSLAHLSSDLDGAS